MAGRGVKREEPALLELGLLDDQSIIRDVGQTQCEGFRYPHAGRGEQTEQRGESDGPDRPGRRERRGCRHQAAYVFIAVDVRNPASEQTAPERVGVGNLVSTVLCVHRDREAPRFEKAVAPLFRRWRFDRPGEDAVRPDDLIAAGLRVGHEVAEEQRLSPELEPDGVSKADVPIQIFTQHHASPGQG
jgi:hypothetical protein